MPNETARTFYALQDKKTGDLARMEVYDGNYQLTRDADYPVFEAPSPEALANVLFENTPSYNTRAQVPGWGEFKGGELVPVLATVTQSVKEVVLPRITNVKTIEVRDIPMRVAVKYAGGEFTTQSDKPGIVFWLVELPEGETLESAQALVGGPAFGGDRWTKRHVYAVRPVPEDYVPLTEGKRPCALLISSGTYY